MTRDQLDRIPDRLLSIADTQQLMDWLAVRGWQMSLLELANERAARNLTRPVRGINQKEN